MSVLGLSFMTYGVGLLGLAAALFLLQRLRVRHREVPVVTTLFWQQATEARRARVFVERFRHPWAYALFLLIAGLLWTAFAQPTTEQDGDVAHVILLDGSAGMAVGNRFEEAGRAAVDLAGSLPRDARQVWLCADTIVPLLVEGEDALLLAKRLEGQSSAPVPASLDRALTYLARAESVAGDGGAAGDAGRAWEVHVVGDAPARAPQGASRIAVRRVPFGPAPSLEDNRGFIAVGVTEAASGAFDAVDLFVRTAGTLTTWRSEPALRSDDSQSYVSKKGMSVVRDVAADGRTLTLRVDADEVLAEDDVATVVLPLRRTLNVAVGDEVPPLLRAILAADPAVEIPDEMPDRPDVAVGIVMDDVPALLVDSPEGVTIELGLGTGMDITDGDAQVALERAYDALHLADLDATRLADATRRPVEVRGMASNFREVRLAPALFEDASGLVGSRALPLLIARTIRWLANVKSFPARVAVGEPLPGVTGELEGPDGARVAVPGEAFTPPAPGVWAEGSSAVGASLLGGVSRASEDATSGGSDSGPGGMPLPTVLLLVAFVLLGLEWVLHQTGRVP